MRKLLAVVLSIAVTEVTQAGSIGRTPQSAEILFELGRYLEFSISNVDPSISGIGINNTRTGVVPSGDMGSRYTSLALGYKQKIGKNVDVALIIDEPVGANVSYPASASPYLLAGSTATLNSTAYTGLLRYKFSNNISLIGGLRLQSLSGKARITPVKHPNPAVGTYTLDVAQDDEWGYVAGIAFEKPEIALRASLIYNSEIKHDFSDIKEFGATSSPFSTIVPKSVNLKLQTGVNKKMLVFTSIRWVERSKFNITPAVYSSPTVVGDSLVNFKHDRIIYKLGLGRKINDKWSVATSIGYEPSKGGVSGNLGPTDGRKSIGLALIHKWNKAKFTGGVSYIEIGDAETSTAFPAGNNFTENKAIGVGLKVGYSF